MSYKGNRGKYHLGFQIYKDQIKVVLHQIGKYLSISSQAIQTAQLLLTLETPRKNKDNQFSIFGELRAPSTAHLDLIM